MDDLEHQLKNALARKDAPDWFEAKVMAAVAQTSRRAHGPAGFRAGLWRWAWALALAILVMGGVAWQQQRAIRDRAAGEMAKARLELALRITSTKLHKIEQKLDELGRNN